MSETSGPTDELTDEPTVPTVPTAVEELPDEGLADDDLADEVDEDAAEEAEGEDDEGDEAEGDEAEEDLAEEDVAAQPATSLADRLEQEGDIAADYLEELLDIADLDGDLDMDVEGERAVVSVVGADLSQLVGARGEVLEALQELTRLAVYRETGERSRLMLDISGHRAQIRRDLEELASQTVAQVRDSGEQVALRPMSPFERKVVHDAVAAAGLTSESEGVEPRRYVVVLPA
jgi:spoIIIJ-associated protein